MMKFAAVKKWKDGGESILEYFDSRESALLWISRQKKPENDEFIWCVGEYE